MVKVITVILILVSGVSAFGQPEKLDNIDSLALHSTFVKLMTAVEKEDRKAISSMSLDSIDCLICKWPIEENYPLRNYMIPVGAFIDKIINGQEIPTDFLLEKYIAHRFEILPVMHYKSYQGYEMFEVWIQAYLVNEIAKGQEGGTYCFMFAKVGSEFKFAGVNSTP